MKKILALIMASVLTLGSLTGCTVGADNATAPAPETQAGAQQETAAAQTMSTDGVKTYDFVFIVKSMQFSFMLSMIDGAEAAAKLVPNINIKCIGPETPYSVEEQIQLVEQAITDEADAILICPADSTGIFRAIE